MSHSGPSTFQDEDGYLQDLALTIRQTDLGQGEANRLLIRAWETAALGALEDGHSLSLDEENALARYADYFSLAQQDLDQNGVQTSLVQAAVLRDVTQGIIPKRQRVNGAVPFNLMKSEQLVWLIQGVDYLETVVPPGAPRHVPRPQHPGRPGPVLPAQHLPQPAHRVGGDGIRRHRDARPHDQAHLLRREPEAVPGPVRQDSRLRPLRRRVRDHAGRADRQAPDLPNRGRLVRLQPSRPTSLK